MSFFNNIILSPSLFLTDSSCCVVLADLKRLPQSTRDSIARLEELTSACRGFTLNVAVSYGGRGEILDVCSKVAGDVQRGEIELSDINERLFASYLSTSHCRGS